MRRCFRTVAKEKEYLTKKHSQKTYFFTLEKNIFYSWQSDLPNNKNRGFIQSCLEATVATLQKEHLHLEIALDRDTKGISGSPDIVSTIFSKIEKASVFVADVSIINSDYPGRKTPNPNVLIELGYAARCLGWDRIICLFNQESGNIEDLPFDLKFRKIIPYRIQDEHNKAKDRKLLASRIEQEFISIINRQTSSDETKSCLKASVDKQLLAIAEDLYKIFYGYETPLTSNNVWYFFELSSAEVEERLFERSFLGFTVLKEWHPYIKSLQSIINQPLFIQHASGNMLSPVLRIIKALELMNHIVHDQKILKDSSKATAYYRIVPGKGINAQLDEDNYALIDTTPDGVRIILDSGHFSTPNLRRLRNKLVVNSSDFSMTIYNVLQALNNWIKSTGGAFIIGPSVGVKL